MSAEKGAAFQILDALECAKEKLRGRVKLPTLEVAVGVELAQRLKREYVAAAVNSHNRDMRDQLITSKIPDLAGHRVYADSSLSARWYEIRMKVTEGCV